MPIWLIILIVLLLLAIGGYIARMQQLKRSRPAFDRSLEQVNRDLATAAASDRGWDRGLLETAARRVYTEQYGGEPQTLTLIEIIDRPGTDSDQAVFDAGGRRLVLGRRDGEWIASS